MHESEGVHQCTESRVTSLNARHFCCVDVSTSNRSSQRSHPHRRCSPCARAIRADKQHERRRNATRTDVEDTECACQWRASDDRRSLRCGQPLSTAGYRARVVRGGAHARRPAGHPRRSEPGAPHGRNACQPIRALDDARKRNVSPPGSMRAKRPRSSRSCTTARAPRSKRACSRWARSTCPRLQCSCVTCRRTARRAQA